MDPLVEWSKTAEHHRNQREFQKALECYTLILSNLGDDDPRIATVLSQRALTYLQMHDFQQSYEDATQALQLNDSIAEALEIRAAAATQLFDWERAVSDYTKQLQVLRNALSTVQAQMSQSMIPSSDSMEDQTSGENTCQTLAKSIYQAYCNRAAIYNKIGEYEKAIRDTSAAMEIVGHQNGNINVSAALNQRADAWNQLGDFDKAISDTTQFMNQTKFFQ